MSDPIHTRLFVGELPHFEAIAWGEGYRRRKEAQIHGITNTNPYQLNSVLRQNYADGWSVAGNEIYVATVHYANRPQRPQRVTRENVNR